MQKGSKICDIVPAVRVSNVQEYYFSGKLKEVAEMNAAGRHVISLGIGSPDIPPSDEAIETLCREARRSDTHGYQPYTGIPELRRAYARWYRRWYGVELCGETEILPLIGSKEGILHVSLAFLNPGDGVLIPDPGYPAYDSVSRLVGAESIPYPLQSSKNWEPDFEALERLLSARRAGGRSRVKLMWTNYPNMPTGAASSESLFERLVMFGRRHGIIICHDNPYSFILNDHPLSMLSAEGAKDVCIELNSMSKAHNMPGWRMAMLASNASFVQWILKVKSNIDSGQFRPMQSAVVDALNASDEWYAGINRIYRKRRRLAGQIMCEMGCSYDERQVGMFLWGRIADAEKNGEALADRMLREAGVFIVPGFVFGSGGERYVRLSLCCQEERLAEALDRLKNLKEHDMRQIRE